MVLTHLGYRDGFVRVRLPDGSIREVAEGELNALAESDHPKAREIAEKVANATPQVPKAPRPRKRAKKST